MEQQQRFCKGRGLPMFAPDDGVCDNCHERIDDNGDKHITGCQHCHRSFCE